MTTRSVEDIARSLDSAWANARTVSAPTQLHPNLSVADAYDVQDLIIAARRAAGRTIAGWKLGLTSAPPPATPIVGTLLDDMVVASEAHLRIDTMVGPMVEGEVVVEIGSDIDGPITVAELAAGPHKIAGGIEVIDYRTVDSGGVIDWIADNSTVAYAVVGESVPLTEIDPAAISVTLYQEDDRIACGSGDLVMGNPLAAVAWLAGHLTKRGRQLSSGQVVLTGSLTGHHVVPGESTRFTADFGALGEVGVNFDL